MRIRFLGVGSAFDEKHTNTSMILEFNGSNMLLDCGYSVPPALWKHNGDPEFLDAIWISHQHGDHFLGLSPLVVRMIDSDRKKPLYLFTEKNNVEAIQNIIETGYRGSLKKAKFEIKFIGFEKQTEFGGVRMIIAPTIHGVENHTVRFEHEDKVFVYSGDGMYTEESLEIIRGADLLVHEAYKIEEETTGHANIKSMIHIKDNLDVKKLAIVHVTRQIRKNKEEILAYIEKTGKEMLVPEEGDVLDV